MGPVVLLEVGRKKENMLFLILFLRQKEALPLTRKLTLYRDAKAQERRS